MGVRCTRPAIVRAAALQSSIVGRSGIAWRPYFATAAGGRGQLLHPARRTDTAPQLASDVPGEVIEAPCDQPCSGCRGRAGRARAPPPRGASGCRPRPSRPPMTAAAPRLQHDPVRDRRRAERRDDPRLRGHLHRTAGDHPLGHAARHRAPSSSGSRRARSTRGPPATPRRGPEGSGPTRTRSSICDVRRCTSTGLTIDAAWPAATCYDSQYGVLAGGRRQDRLGRFPDRRRRREPLNGCQGGIGIQIGTAGPRPLEAGRQPGRHVSGGYQKNGIDGRRRGLERQHRRRPTSRGRSDGRSPRTES